MANSRAKHWVFTLNNYTNEELTLLRTLVPTQASYVCFGLEVGENETPHVQGYLSLERRLRLQQVRHLVPRAHFEVRRGSHRQAKEYCEKDGVFEEFGLEPVEPGSRTDLTSLQNDLRAGKRLRDIADEHFATFLRYPRGIIFYRNVVVSPRDWVCSVVVYCGRTGAGKTRAVYQNLPSPEVLYVHPGGCWFDGYDGHEIVLFDDFGGAEFKLSYLLKLLDRYRMQVPIKGGFVNWAPHEIYITSNLHPNEWYRNCSPEHIAALFRRFTNLVIFD